MFSFIDVMISCHNKIDFTPNLWIGPSWFDHNPATHSLDHGVYVRPRFVHSIADRRIVPRCWHLTTILSFQRTRWRRWQRNHAKWKSVSWGNFCNGGKFIQRIIFINLRNSNNLHTITYIFYCYIYVSKTKRNGRHLMDTLKKMMQIILQPLTKLANSPLNGFG